jgi:hypothetical protein
MKIQACLQVLDEERLGAISLGGEDDLKRGMQICHSYAESLRGTSGLLSSMVFKHIGRYVLSLMHLTVCGSMQRVSLILRHFLTEMLCRFIVGAWSSRMKILRSFERR